ncbi:MAG: hypothetical protein LC645_09720, partial [Geobacteraceae bacterium]|nr:hypothetical protein [Geobacteraceae bacterium]
LVLNRHDPHALAFLEYALQELHWNDHQGMLAGICDLAPPPELASDAECYGSLFLLLHKDAPRVYGDIECTADGMVINGEPLRDLPTLLQRCARNTRIG